MKPRILVFADWYLPGYKAGGALTAISNLVKLMGDEFDFCVFTHDRDRTDDQPYSKVPVDRWVTVGKARVFYTSDLSMKNLLRRIREIGPDIIYLNSFFSRLTVKTLVLRKMGLLPEASVVLAPRGEFSRGALELKRSRKFFYSKAALAAGLCRDILWQASSVREEEQIRAMTFRSGSGNNGTIQLAPDVPNPSLFSAPPPAARPAKVPGALRFIFLSRVSRMKNLQFALELLSSVHGEIQFDIYGPIDDAAYWEACQGQIRRLPNSIRVSYKGPVAQEHVVKVFAKYHFQLLPTLGENFGYVIIEGLAAGCPILTSDQTPWRELSKKRAGWDLPLGDRGQWRQAIQRCVEMDQNAYESLSLGARSYFEEWMSSSAYRQGSMELFRKALETSASSKVPPALEKSARTGN
jgi:glycosyltransferase involved in cell wall biosynthesis